MVYTLRFFFSLKCSLFHNSNLFGSCIIHILYTGCAKIKKNISGAKRLTLLRCASFSGMCGRYFLIMTKTGGAFAVRVLVFVLLLCVFLSREISEIVGNF